MSRDSSAGGGIDFPGYAPEPVVQALAFRAFDPIRSAWVERSETASDVALPAIRCVTFNTWFQGGERKLRYAGLLAELREADADVILLQEATVELVERCEEAPWLRAAYRMARAPFRADGVPSHGVMLLTRLPLRDATLHPIPTHMGRRLLTAHCRINGALFVFATAHLESMKPNADVRGEQLRAIFAQLEGAHPALFAGDFNFCSSSVQENGRLDPRFVDAWPAVHREDPGFTQDTDINRMLALAKREAKRVRYDRILLRGGDDGCRWAVESVRLLGTRPVGPEHPMVFPSDHFGVLATLRAAAPESRPR